ncbi:MAG: DUF2799 domain-containing protein [Comamonas sp.]
MKPLRHTPLLLALSAAVALAGCAAMSQEECRTADWGEQGMRDALNGHPRSRLADIREACAEAGVVPIESLYWNGWNAGIARFCTPENGERWGRDGRSYHNSCPPQIEAGFLSRYRAGRRVYDAEQALQQLQREQDRLQWQLNGEKDEARRQRLRASLRDLDLRLAMARDELNRAQWRLRTGR